MKARRVVPLLGVVGLGALLWWASRGLGRAPSLAERNAVRAQVGLAPLTPLGDLLNDPVRRAGLGIPDPATATAGMHVGL